MFFCTHKTNDIMRVSNELLGKYKKRIIYVKDDQGYIQIQRCSNGPSQRNLRKIVEIAANSLSVIFYYLERNKESK